MIKGLFFLRTLRISVYTLKHHIWTCSQNVGLLAVALQSEGPWIPTGSSKFVLDPGWASVWNYVSS